MTKDTCWTSSPRPHISVAIRTLLDPLLKSSIIASLSFCTICPCIIETVKLASLIFSVNHSTFDLLLQKITACVITSVSYKSHKVSNFHFSSSTATKYCRIPSNESSSLLTKIFTGFFMNFSVISRIS